MKKYIFITSDGSTQDSLGTDTENCQVIGWGTGNNEQNALDKFKQENSWIKELSYTEVQVFEMKKDIPYFLSL